MSKHQSEEACAFGMRACVSRKVDVKSEKCTALRSFNGKLLVAAAILCALGPGALQVSLAANNISISAGVTVNIDDDTSGNFSSNDDAANLNVADILSDWSSSTPVTVTTKQLGGDSEPGMIDIDAALDFNGYTSSSLGLIALDVININANLFDSDGGSADTLTLNLTPTGVVNLNAEIGGATNTTINGDLVIGLTGTYNLIGAADSLSADSISNSAGGAFNFSAGSLTLNSALDINAAGLLGDTVVLGSQQSLQTLDQVIGAGGSFTLDGGSNTVTNELEIQSGGSLVLNSGSLSANSIVNDGSADVTGTLSVADMETYTQSGDLTADDISAAGALTQTGGTTTVSNSIIVNDTGSYTLSGGSLTAGVITRSSLGDFTFTSGDLTLTSGTLAVQADGLLGGAVSLDAAHNLHTANQSIGTPDPASGTLTQNEGTNTVDSALTVNAGGTYNLYGGILAAGTLAADGTFSQSGGSNTVGGALSIGTVGSYTLSGGSLVADTLDDSAGGSFTWTNGDLTLVSDDVAVDGTTWAGSSLTLTGSKSLHTSNQTIGTATAGSGSISQQLSSSNEVDGMLTINAGGSYDLAKGLLTAGSVTTDGTFTQTGSANTSIAGALTLNAGSTYSLGGGILAAGSIDNSGAITQTIGINTVSGALKINAGGSYDLSKGNLSADSFSNSGTMTQTGGSTTVTNALTINAGGNYNLNAGSLTAGSITNNGAMAVAAGFAADDMTVGTPVLGGSVNQTGGSSSSVGNTLTINEAGSYALTGGSLSAGNIVNSGTITHSSNADVSVTSTLTMSAGSTYALSGDYTNCGFGNDCDYLSAGTINNSGAMTQTGGINSAGSMTVENGGSYDLSAGQNSLGTLTINAGGSYSLSGSAGSLSAGSIGNSGTMTQADGYNNVSGALTIAGGASYNMNGGTLIAGAINRVGTFNYTGGEVRLTASDLEVDSTGLLGASVSIASGQTFQAVNQNINSGGSINQTGGLNVADNILTIDPGGSYTLSGGTLKAASVANNGNFNYTSGSMLLTNSDLVVDSTGLLGASLSILSGENFDANNQTVGSGGSISQSGGSNNVDNVLTINTGGNYTMADGSLVADSVVKNGGTFTYTGGAVQLTGSDLAVESSGLLGANITIADGQTFGSVNQSVGTAVASSGSVNQTDGFNIIDDVLTVNSGGTYTMSGGSLVTGSVVNNGAFNYTGGAVRLTSSDLNVDSTGLLGSNISIVSGQAFGSVNQTVGTAAAGSGSVSQTGGSNTVDNLLTINSGGSYDLNGGSLWAAGIAIDGAMDQEGGLVQSTGSMSVSNGGSYAQTGGQAYISNTLTVGSGSSYSLNGGYLNVGDIVNNGSFTFTSGALEMSSALSVSTGALLGDNISIDGGKSLGVYGAGGINIVSGSAMTLNGGSIDTSAITGAGAFTFNSGFLDINDLTVGSGGLLGSNVELTSARVLQIDNTATVGSGAMLTVTSGSSSFDTMVNNGTVSVSSGSSMNVSTSYTQNSGSTTVEGVLDAGNAYTQNDGSTTVNGTLDATTVTIAGGMLTGSGIIAGNLEVTGSGLINPGNSPGDLEIASKLILSANGTLEMEVGDDPSIMAGDYLWDRLIADDYDLAGGKVIFNLLDSVDINIFTSQFSIDDFFRVGDGSQNFGFLESGLELALLENLSYRAYDTLNDEWSNISLDANGGFIASAAVPVPAAAWLFCSGLLGLVAAARRKSA